MTYDYRSSGSTVTGAIAPLDHAARNVKIHIARILQWAPAESVLLGVPYYGYNWPVTSEVPNATVQSNKTNYGAGQERHLRERARLPRGPPEDRAALRRRSRAAPTTPTGRRRYKTYRQVYFDDEHSLAAKYDYALIERPRRGRHLDARQRPRLRGRSGTCCATSSTRRSTRSKVTRQGRADRAVGRRRLRERPRPAPATTGTVPDARLVAMDHPRPGRHSSSVRRGPQKQTLYPGRLAEAHRAVSARPRDAPAGGHATRSACGSSRANRRRWRSPASSSANGTERSPDEILGHRRNLATSCGPVWRLTAMHTPIRPIASCALRQRVAGRVGDGADPGPAAGGPFRRRRPAPDPTT